MQNRLLLLRSGFVKRHPDADLLEAYAEADDTGVSFRQTGRLPTRSIVRAILDSMVEFVLPGYYGPGFGSADFANGLARRSRATRDLLEEELARARQYDLRLKRCTARCRSYATEVAEAMFRERATIVRLLRKDIKAAHDGDPASRRINELAATSPGVYAIAVHRIVHTLQRMDVPIIPRMMQEIAHARTGIDIHPGAKIGEGFAIDHGTGVVIGETTEIGKHCRLYQGVTLGALNFPQDDDGNLQRGPGAKRHPTLQDHVIVFANASVLGGNVVVGRNSTIGANVRVTKSIPPEHLVKVDKDQSGIRIEPKRERSPKKAAKTAGSDHLKTDANGYEKYDLFLMDQFLTDGNNCSCNGPGYSF